MNELEMDNYVDLFCAGANLYGVVSVDELFKTYCNVDERESFYNVFEVMKESSTLVNVFKLPDGYYISAYKTKEDTLECLKYQKGKKLEVLSKQEFLKFSKPLYYEEDEDTKNLYNFIVGLNAKNSKSVMYDIMDKMRNYKTSPNEIVQIVVDSSRKELDEIGITLLVGIITNLWNNARNHYNRGKRRKEVEKQSKTR